MCGIAGFSGNFEIDLLHRMGTSLAHRGPDGQGIFTDDSVGVGLVHRRLAIIDLSSAGHQPMVDASDKAVISFNGEIYNFRELRTELVASGCFFKGKSDTEVLLNLYIRYGMDMFNRLNGIYAFAIWDKIKKSMMIARDGLGVKPLYYSNTERGFIFASEIKALLQEGSVARQIDPGAVARHLTFLWSPAPTTILKNVLKLEPGTALIVRDGVEEQRFRFYSLPIGRAKTHRPVPDACKEVRSLLDQAVERQMVSDVPVGAFLSGGLDSSAIVASARKIAGDRLQCFTIELDDKGAMLGEGMTNDLPYARRVADHLNVDLNVVKVNPGAITRLPEIIWYLDEPQADPAILNTYFISELARECGIKVLLSGAGGDDIFTGYRRHRALMLEHYWRWLPAGVRTAGGKLSSMLPANIPLTRRLRKAFEYAGLNDDAHIASYLFWLSPNISAGLLNKEFSQNYSPKDIVEPLEKALETMPTAASDLDKLLYLDCRYFLADHNLNYTDRMSMAHGVETRVPLLDLDLVDYAATVSDDMKQRGREGKWIFKKAMEGILPNDVIYRPKTGFGAPLRHWLKHDLAEMVGDILSPSAIRRRGIFDAVAVESLVARDRAGEIDAAYPIFSLLSTELWCRSFIDGTASL